MATEVLSDREEVRFFLRLGDAKQGGLETRPYDGWHGAGRKGDSGISLS